MNKFAQLKNDKLEAHFNDYLLDHWSYSSLRSFKRNEKAFEMRYIFKIYDISSGVSAWAGKIYHACLQIYFDRLKSGEDLPDLNESVDYAQQKIDNINPDEFDPPKGSTLEKGKADIEKSVNSLLTNFYAEADAYVSDIKEVLFVEERMGAWVTICGNDIPLPVVGYPDLIYVNHQEELCILDHKSKKVYTKEDEINAKCSGQATIYRLIVNALIEEDHDDWKPFIKKYPKIKEGLRQFYYYENKSTQNRDKSRQIRRIVIDIDETSKLYEILLYPAVRRMMNALSDPDYDFLENEDDNFSDKGKIQEFTIKTLVKFDLDDFKKLSPLLQKKIKRIREEAEKVGISKMPKSFIKQIQEPKNFVSFNPQEMENLPQAKRIEHALRYFNLFVQVAHEIDGYASKVYLLRVGAGTRISQIMRSEMDIANALGVPSVRTHRNLIQRENESFLAVEVNKPDDQRKYPDKPEVEANKIPIGISNFDEVAYWDLDNPSTPHLLISGATGSGKSVTIKSIINSLEALGHKAHIIDPKFEFTNRVASENEGIDEFLQHAIDKMNAVYRSGQKPKQKEVIIFDECADAFMQSGGKEIKRKVLQLAQKARAAGIHLVLSSQRFSTKIMSGDIKANFPTRLALTCAKAVDSQVMLDEAGAEKLAGKGDALFASPTIPNPLRIQCYA